MSDLFKNKVAESGIITLNLEDFLPAEKDLILFDLKAFLFMGLISPKLFVALIWLFLLAKLKRQEHLVLIPARFSAESCFLP